jgi:hypothetical protein
MVTRFNIFKIKAVFVVRHIWEEDRSIANWPVYQMRKTPTLGIWFKRNKLVGPVRKSKTAAETVNKTFSSSNLVNEYIIGLDLIVCKSWIAITTKPSLTIKI